jgi:hypothetical protein
MLIQFQYPINISNIQLFKIKPEFSFTLERVILYNVLDSGDSYYFLVQNNQRELIEKWIQNLRREIPKGQYLNFSIKDNILKCKVPKIKGIQQLQSNGLIVDEYRKWVNINIYIDNIYKFKNNHKNYYFCIKLKEIEYIS